MNSKAVKAGLIAAALTLGAYWYWSPFLVIHSMQSAAEAKDADRFNEHVDYPKLRESLKGQFYAAMGEKVEQAGQGGSEMERAGAALGSMLGKAMVDGLVDAMVRPEVVMRAMREAELQRNPAGKHEAGDGHYSDEGASKEKVKWGHERLNADKLLVFPKKDGEVADKSVGLVFERTGFANWKLAEIRIPVTR